MKKLRILCLALALVLVLPMIASCSGNKVVSNNVTVKFQAPKDVEAAEKEYETLFELALSVEGTKDNMPNVLQVAETALRQYEIDYELSKDGASIAGVFDRVQSDSADAEKGYYYYWDVTVNGKASDAGRQSVTLVYDDDVIVYTWTYGEQNRRDTDAVVTTDPNEDTTAADVNAVTTEPEADDYN